ncbi:MAG: signal peptide peptidase SppA [Bacteroidales bacterium]|nr:signal peptide peptidase SppA [Bacteroidales bacterium]
MKDFLKMLLAVLCGLLVAGFLFFVVLAGFIGAAASMGSGAKPVLPKSGVLAIDMSRFVLSETEQPANPMSSLNGKAVPNVSLYKAVKALELAAKDPGVKYVYLLADGNLSSVASLEEFRAALAEFRRAGKAVVAFSTSPSTAAYWLASVADKVYMTSYPGGMVTLNGVSMQAVFLKDLLDKFGVNVQLIRHGKYKSAGEMYIRNSASPENREQYQAMVDALWGTISGQIAESRGIPVEALNAAIDGLTLCLPEDFLSAGLVDGLLSREELKDKLATYAGEESFSEVKMISFPDYVQAKILPQLKPKNKIAVIYADGNIVEGDDPLNVDGDRFARTIDKVRSDSTVKAVVLRVNSPGGSVLASDKIKHELDLLGQVKPLVASYGTYAASGGYWISNNCGHIFTDATTLTGSIGVFGLVPEFSKTAKKVLHVGVMTVTSNKHGDMYSLMRPFDPDEYAYVERSIEDVYDRFTSIVADGRDMTKERVDEIGQGRVWAGSDALGIGLVDEIGTLRDAIRYAASAAGIAPGAESVVAYPAPMTELEMIMEMFGQKSRPEEFVKVKLREYSRPQVLARLPFECSVK